MCGIVGYIGKELSKNPVLEGLTRLEYRGYDAGGFGCFSSEKSKLSIIKALGGVQSLKNAADRDQSNGYVGVGHMRWSTHGAASDLRNAHPHKDCDDTVLIVHNGIIENYHALKTSLQKDHIFTSDTDTECIAHLVENLKKKYHTKYTILFKELLATLDGAYALAILFADTPETLFIARHKSPLCIGRGNDEMFIASDPLAFHDQIHEVFYMPDGAFAFVHTDHVEVFDAGGNALQVEFKKSTNTQHSFDKGPYNHFMLKEIYEQRPVIAKTLHHWSHTQQLMESLRYDAQKVAQLKRLHFVACGTSWHAAHISAHYFEKIAHVPCYVHLASEFRYAPFFVDDHSMYLGVSQSGETADTLEALRMVKERDPDALTIAVTNVATSSMARECEGLLWTQAGPEIAVASTKAFTAQLATLYLTAHLFGLIKKTIDEEFISLARTELHNAAIILENSIENYKQFIVDTFVPRYAQSPYFIFLGRQSEYYLALEAALKLKEIAYIFSEAYPAGELKHGPLALISPEVPVVLFSSLDPLIYTKLLANAQEIKSRNGHLIIFSFDGQKELQQLANENFIIPKVNPLLSTLAVTGLMQFIVYEIAHYLDRPIDKPRNLAKSVTVE